MPELPEVETVARTLRPRLVGHRILEVDASGLPLRRPIDLARLRAACAGARVAAVRRLGKYLLIDLSSGQVLIVHLGMTGRLLFADRRTARPRHTHAIFRLSGGEELRYVDPRRFGVLRVYPRAGLGAAPELAVLGVDPFDSGFTLDYLRAQLRHARCNLKAFLMDQGRVAGIGNIYACEALYRAGLSPRRRAQRVTAAGASRLYEAIGHVLEAGVRNRGTTFSDYVDAEGQAGGNQLVLGVYGRAGEPCRRCHATIRRITQGARSTFYCARCQK
jgi:formamidopyrimidine-DNA glycosylase